jgi:hypothetical protein
MEEILLPVLRSTSCVEVPIKTMVAQTRLGEKATAWKWNRCSSDGSPVMRFLEVRPRKQHRPKLFACFGRDVTIVAAFFASGNNVEHGRNYCRRRNEGDLEGLCPGGDAEA